jgi:hypothetical protein
MREMMSFYKKQIEECKGLARQSSSRSDKAFWHEAAGRWAAILQQYEKPSVAKNMERRANTRRISGPRKAA